MTDCFIVIEHQSDQWDNFVFRGMLFGIPSGNLT